MTTRAELSKLAEVESGPTRLIRAAHKGDLRTVRLLLNSGSDVNARDADGRVPLMFAVINRHAEVVRELLENGADVNAQAPDGATPLLSAVSCGDQEIVKTLLDHGADVSASYSSSGETALMLAHRNHHEEVASLLRQYGAKT
jgi:uncharacterized protein